MKKYVEVLALPVLAGPVMVQPAALGPVDFGEPLQPAAFPRSVLCPPAVHIIAPGILRQMTEAFLVRTRRRPGSDPPTTRRAAPHRHADCSSMVKPAHIHITRAPQIRNENVLKTNCVSCPTEAAAPSGAASRMAATDVASAQTRTARLLTPPARRGGPRQPPAITGGPAE